MPASSQSVEVSFDGGKRGHAISGLRGARRSRANDCFPNTTIVVSDMLIGVALVSAVSAASATAPPPTYREDFSP